MRVEGVEPVRIQVKSLLPYRLATRAKENCSNISSPLLPRLDTISWSAGPHSTVQCFNVISISLIYKAISKQFLPAILHRTEDITVHLI